MREVIAVDTCAICGREQTASNRLWRVADGCVCNRCVEESGLASEYSGVSKLTLALSGRSVEEVKEHREQKLAEAISRKRKAIQFQTARTESIKESRKEELRLAAMPVTTMDVQRPYDVLGPLFFQISNKGILSSSYERLAVQYAEEIKQRRSEGLFSPTFADWGFLFGTGWGVGQNQFDSAFYISVQELKKRALMVGADAIVGLRMDFDLDTNAFEYFYLQVYGTAVRYKER